MRRLIDKRWRREDEIRNELLSGYQTVPPVVSVSPLRRPFVVGKPQQETIARMTHLMNYLKKLKMIWNRMQNHHSVIMII
jgi:hypothetical protein